MSAKNERERTRKKRAPDTSVQKAKSAAHPEAAASERPAARVRRLPNFERTLPPPVGPSSVPSSFEQHRACLKSISPPPPLTLSAGDSRRDMSLYSQRFVRCFQARSERERGGLRRNFHRFFGKGRSFAVVRSWFGPVGLQLGDSDSSDSPRLLDVIRVHLGFVQSWGLKVIFNNFFKWKVIFYLFY